MIDWSSAYEAPLSLDVERLLGTGNRRQSLWTLSALGVLVPIIAIFVLFEVPHVKHDIPDWLYVLSRVLLPVACVYFVITRIFSKPWGPRYPEYWLKVWLRHKRLPRFMQGEDLRRHHADISVREHVIEAPDFPRGVVEVDTLNLSLRDSDTLKTNIGNIHNLFVGLTFPIQIVVRAWQRPDRVDRRWFIAVVADTEPVLKTRLGDVIKALRRAGLGGRELNGDLYDSLQACWSVRAGAKLGPGTIQRERYHVIVDGEYVRGLMLKRLPKFVEPNWMAPMLDGELAVDCSVWIDPIDNATESQYLQDRINEWETAQILDVNQGRYRDPERDDWIKDAKVTKLRLRQHQLKVFNGSVGFVVRGMTLAECQERERLLLDHIREQVGEDAVVPLDLEHDKAPTLAVPIGYPLPELPFQIVSPALAMSYFFSNSCISMIDGIECGTSIDSKRVNRLDVLQLTNPHMIVPGTSGAGKGYWIKIFFYRLLMAFPDRLAWIIQTEKDEYGALVDAMPDYPQGYVTPESVLRYIPEPNRRYLEADPPRSRGAKITIRSLNELDAKLWHVDNSLYRHLSGAQLTVYDLTKMPQAEHGEAIARILVAIRQYAASKKVLGYMAIDELGIVTRDDKAALAIETAYRTFRSIPLDAKPSVVSRVGMIGMTQLPSDLLGHKNGSVYAKLSEAGLYLRQKPAELKVTKEPLGLTPGEVQFLSNAFEGEALLVAGIKRVTLKLEASAFEHEFART